MQESTLVIHPDFGLSRKVVVESFENIEITQLEAKVESDTQAVIEAQARMLSTARGVLEGNNDLTQLQLVADDETKAKAALEDSKSELSLGQELVANSAVSGAEVPGEDGANGTVEDSY